MLEVSDDNSTVSLSVNNGDGHVRVELASPRFRYRDPANSYLVHDDVVEYVVRLSGHGFSAEVPVVSLDTAGSGLPGFLAQLAEDFGGWDGERTWENADHQLGVEARWFSRGNVDLRWWIAPSGCDRWSASVVVEVEAGEEMSALARELASFFAL